MPSTFTNLLRYARATTSEATENFTTEALAACIRADPVPILTLLERHLVIGAVADVQETVALTQVAVASAGIIDLVLQLRLLDRLSEVWVEVKVAAGESGQQIDNYRAYIAAQPAAVRPQLVTLSRTPIRVDPYLTWLSWQSVRATARASPSPYWRDLAAFLEDVHMADDFDAPVTPAEAGSLGDAHRLRGKVLRILGPLMQEAALTWPAVPWPVVEADLTARVDEWYRMRGRLAPEVWAHSRTGGWLALGVWPGAGEAELGVSVTTDPRYLASRTVIIGLADQGALPPTWRRSFAGWEALTVRAGLAAFPDHDSARGWLRARLHELDASGILVALPGLTPL